ncbi:hypothetical protein D083_4010 [Dickeya solani RNS 08.23.3.1.A]|nr:hypothetical protein D083_4010 [Dickeya solani RNS 08.23.3.1.A]
MEYSHGAKMIVFMPGHNVNETFHHYFRHEKQIKRRIIIQLKATSHGVSAMNHQKKRLPPLWQQNL